MNEHSDPLKDALEGDKPHVPLGDLRSSSLRLVPAEGNTTQMMFSGGKVSKMQIISLVLPQTISLSTSKLRKVLKDCKKIWKQEWS